MRLLIPLLLVCSFARAQSSGSGNGTPAKIASYEVGAEDGAILVTSDLIVHALDITDGTARTLTEASCVVDTAGATSQQITVYSGATNGTALFTITCVVPASYSTGTVTGTTGYINAANMTSTAVAAHTMIGMCPQASCSTGVANGATHDVKLYIYAN